MSRLPSLTTAVANDFRSYLTAHGVDELQIPTFIEIYRHLAAFQRVHDRMPTSIAELVGNSSAQTYKFLNERAASQAARARTKRWHDALRSNPDLALAQLRYLDIQRGDWSGTPGWAGKSGFVIGNDGVQAVEVRRAYGENAHFKLALELIKNSNTAGLRQPIVTTNRSAAMVNAMLGLSLTHNVPWTGRISGLYNFPAVLGARSQSPAGLDRLSIADALSAETDGDTPSAAGHQWFHFTRVRPQAGSRERLFLAYGPSDGGAYYLQHRSDEADRDDELDRLKSTIDLIESTELHLDHFDVERLRVKPSRDAVYERQVAVLLLIEGFAFNYTPESVADEPSATYLTDDMSELL